MGTSRVSLRLRCVAAVIISAGTLARPGTVSAQESMLLDGDGVRLSRPDTPGLTQLNEGVAKFQRSPFDAIIDVNFLPGTLVGEAFAELAHFAGYDVMVSGAAIDPMAKTFFARPLSRVHGTFEYVSVRDALVSLAGQGYTVVVDHARRIVSVDVRPSFRVMLRLEDEVRR